MDPTPSTPWKQRTAELADWADRRLVNRRDAWGQYILGGVITAPPRNRRGKEYLTATHFEQHFAGKTIIGVHSSGADRSRWIAFDIDRHNDAISPAVNCRILDDIIDATRGVGLEPSLVEDSDGRGGFHVWTLFDRPIELLHPRWARRSISQSRLERLASRAPRRTSHRRLISQEKCPRANSCLLSRPAPLLTY